MFLCKKAGGGVRILSCSGYDGRVTVPERLGGLPVTEIGAYAFSASRKIEDGGIWIAEEEADWEKTETRLEKTEADWEKAEIRLEKAEASQEKTEADWERAEASQGSRMELSKGGRAETKSIPEIRGDRLLSIELPASVQAIGRYAFYNCDHLEEICLSSGIRDIGSGVFTGSTGVRRLDITIENGVKSCFKEVLSELRQELYVTYRSGAGKARLVFPPYFEEAVENTPAKVFRTEIHGCGHRYRYCFDQTEFQFKEYDALFPYVKVQEAESLVVRLALGRLYFPVGLSQEAKEVYGAYVEEHLKQAAGEVLRYGEPADILFLAERYGQGREALELLVGEANRLKKTEAVGCLMDYMRRHHRTERRRHTL